ncbi:iron complex outermembrane receptor protein [Sphingobium fontiphilum]|uniref:Iron complex outermembrane receptor protein n=1 Tax=Sphingobium fontiphilum TaxID=944425 RepID=A0A7W6GND2_9SPHN|nr:TonB-dependent receptor [Sphingobium fontiphilum]MBB3981392.1 iron complex outermembrane receptor protein [Sphingobium fontiphilum]
MRTSLLAIAACLVATPALADEASDEAARDQIVVTGLLERQAEAAGRLGLTNRETPAIVDVVTQEDFQAQGVRNAIEALNAAPGVASGTLPGSMGSVSMRGFHRAVNYLYDGVRMANSDVGVRNWDSWSFERIEVIKGPASVTSGEGALAGAINFVPRRPKLGETSGEMLASYGSFDTARLAGDVNLPLGDTVAARVNASWSRTSGWIDDTDSNTFAVSGSLLFKPTERFSLTVSADYFRDKYSTIYYGTPVVSRDVARDPSDAVSGSAGLVLDKAMRRVNFNLTDGDMGSDTIWLRARADYELTDTLHIVSDTSWYTSDRQWQDSDEYGFNAGTGLIDRYLTLITHDHQYWNQRLHLAFDGKVAGLRNRFTLGVEFGKTDFFTVRRFGTAASADPFNPVRGTFPADTPANFGTRQNVSADVKAFAVFAEDALNLTPDWLLVGGIRFDNFKLDRSVLNVTANTTQNYGQDYDAVSWRAGTVYSITPRTQLFAQYTRAVTPLSGLLFMSATNANFKLTTGYSYEAGIKTSLTGSGVELTASAFKIRQDDILTRDPVNPAVVLQGGNLQSKGVEVSLNLPATEDLDIALSGTLLDAEYGQLVEAGGANRSGNRPPNVPERLADAVVTWSPKALPITLTGSVRHNGGFYTSNANTVRVNAFTTVDAAIAWNASFGTLTLRGRNLTDKFYADWSGYASGLLFIGAPRSVELSLTRKF